jgi:segregation and condensation protein A
VDEDISVPDMILHLASLLRRTGDNEPLRLVPLFERQRSVRAMISMFLAVLELVRRQAVTLVQAEAFGEIGMKRRAGFDQVLTDSNTITEVEKDYK